MNKLPQHAKIVIVGGGIMGVGLLYHLAEEGCTDALLIEKAELTSGSTWHAAGQCPSLVGNYNLAKIHHHGNTLYPKLEQLTGQSVSWHGSGGIRIARTKDDLDWFNYMQGIADNIGFRMQIIGPDEIRKINPFMNTEGVLAGAWTLDDGHADPAGLTQAMARGATNFGASIIRHNRVIDINVMPNREWQVVTEKGIVTAEIVVNAAGCYARQVAKMVGTDLPICNIEHHYIVTESIPEFEAREEEIPVIRDPYASAYIRQEQNSGLIGIYEQKGLVQAWAPRGFPNWDSESELFSDDLERLMPWLGRAMERMPVLEAAGIKRIVNGAIPHTADGPPLLGPVAGLRNFWLCCGSSFGIAQGAGCGKYLAQWILHGDSEINMTGFDPRRFGGFADDDYMRAKGFQDYGMTYFTPLPGEELPAARNLRQSALHGTLADKGCVFTQTFGWERPKWFAIDDCDEAFSYRRNNVFEIVRKECLSVKERVGILDLSGFAKYEVCGPDAAKFLNRICANRIPKKTGRVTLTHVLSEAGRIQAEMTITRLADDQFYILSAAGAELRDLDFLNQGCSIEEQVTIRNVTDELGVLVVAGPKSRDLLQPLTETSLATGDFPWLTGREMTIGEKPVRALRVNYVGELGWELHVAVADMQALYSKLWHAGQDLGIANFGLYAVNSLRIEKGYKGWSAELTNEITLLHAAMDRFVRFEKQNFVGRDAMLAKKEEGLSGKIVYVEIAATDSDIRGGEPVFDGDTCIGVTTSGGYGHRVQKSLGFAYVDINHAAVGSRFEISLLGQRLEAKVLKDQPVYDPDNLQLKA
ncbi:MAG: FAD-dependent oxidoreductase [Pseudomonadales bacterium]